MIKINVALNCRCWWNTWAAKIAFELYILTEPHTLHFISHVLAFMRTADCKASAGFQHTAKGRRKIWGAELHSVEKDTDWSRLRNEPSSQFLTDRLFGSQRAVYLDAWKKKMEKKEKIPERFCAPDLLPPFPWVEDRGTDLCLHDATLWFTWLWPPHSPLAG